MPSSRLPRTALHAYFGRPPVRLFFTSATVLYFELLLIRWIPSNVVYVGYFSNFILMGSFLGIGVGILLGRNGRTRGPWLAILLFAVVTLCARAQLNLQLSSASDIYFGLADEAHAADVNFLVLPLVVMLAASVMAAAALPLGTLLTSDAPLRVYAIDIVGSIAGIVLFTVLSMVGAQPVAWFAIASILMAAQAIGVGTTAWSAVSATCMIALVVSAATLTDTWSPYQRITLTYTSTSVGINADGVPHQGFFLDPSQTPYAFYTQLDRWFPQRQFKNVLVIGAGAGNDTQSALSRGAVHVDAVEIDPTILSIGERLNPARPYSDPRVSVHVDDGRAYLRNSTASYDLIVYAVTDSLTLVSNTANLRLESYLFTQQAFASVRDHLAPDGVFLMYNFYRQPWLVSKLDGMLATSFGYPPIVKLFPHLSGSGAVFATGPAIAALSDHSPPGDSVDPVPAASVPPPATDDWPFVYLQSPGIASFYLLAIGLLVVLAGVAFLGTVRFSGASLAMVSPHFFTLGTAFMLLETRSLATFSLLFGTTWLVNALAFVAILLSVLLAIGAQRRWRFRRRWPLYGVLAATITVAYLLPPDALLFDPAWLRFGLAATLAFAPVFVANLVFAQSFQDARRADIAFASNMLGAVIGGTLEYLALICGYRTLLLVVLVLYAAAALLAGRFRALGDRHLGTVT